MNRAVRRCLIGLASLPLVALLLLVAIVSLWVSGVHLPFAGATWMKVEKTGRASFDGDWNGPVYVLVVGNDAREDIGGARADAVHLIGINPQTRQGTIIDFPRDTAVSIPGQGTDKINAAFAYGGLDTTVETVAQLVGVEISYAVTTNFDGFMALVNEMGGVTVNVLEPHDDSNFSGADFSPGPVHMDGGMALAYCRDRHSFSSGDIKRSENQGYFVLQALAEVRARASQPSQTLHMVSILTRHVELKGMNFQDLYALGRLATSIDPAQVRNVVVPVGSGSGSNLALGGGAESLFADFRDDAVLQSN